VTSDFFWTHKVLRFSASGTLLGQAGFRQTKGRSRTKRDRNGSGRQRVFADPSSNGDTDIVRLVLAESLPSFDPFVASSATQQGENAKGSFSADLAQVQPAAVTVPQLTRSQITKNASSFVNSTVWTSAANIGTTASCKSRVIPAFLKGKPAGYYPVAYSWGC